MAAWGSPLPTVTYSISDFASLNNAVARADNGSRASPRIACGHRDRLHVGVGATPPTHSRALTSDAIASVCARKSAQHANRNCRESSISSAVRAYATGTSPRSVTTADVNGDGQVDLVVANYGTGLSEPPGGQI
jgi:FG-GAP repeat protein